MKLRLLLAGFLVVTSTLVNAGDIRNALQVDECASASNVMGYVVSGVLVVNGSTTEIKLVHGLQIAPSKEDAQAAFTQQTLNKYPGYTMATTLATVVSTTVNKCGLPI